MKNKYATKLTKEELIQSGITEITKEGLVFSGETPVNLSVNAQGYLMLAIYKLDEDGNKLKRATKIRYKDKIYNSYAYDVRSIGLHRAMWAWHYGEVPEGYVVDHISNKHTELEDYNLNNLQLLTPAENLEKEREKSTKQVRCKLNKPLSFYQEKLNRYTEEYNKAKEEHNAAECHRLRGNVATAKAKIRYYLAHKEEAEALQKKEVKPVKQHKAQKVYVKNDLYHEVANMKKLILEKSQDMPWKQGKELRRFVRLYNHDRDYEILKQLYTALNK